MKKKVYGLIGIAALVAVGGTFAYYNSSQTFGNPFDTTNYSTSTQEKFNPADSDDWYPGKKVDKKVTATNTGDGLVWVRVKFDEEWQRNGSLFKTWDSQNEKFFPTVPGAPGTAGGNQADVKDGYTEADTGSVVYKELTELLPSKPDVPTDGWFYNTEDGYFYYARALSKDESTGELLKSVTLCGDTDMGYYNNIDAWKIVDKGATEPVYKDDPTSWITTGTPSDGEMEGKDVYHYKADELIAGREGYANADYALNITVEFIQTTDRDENGNLPENLGNWGWYPPATPSSAN